MKTSLLTTTLLSSALLLSVQAQQQAEPEQHQHNSQESEHASELHFSPVYNQDLSNTVKRGGNSTFERNQHGHIVGTVVFGGPNTFLCSEAEYSDFVLRYSYQVDQQLNSGVMIRSQVDRTEGDTEIIAGPQIEIDHKLNRERFWSAGIYGEQAGGWISPDRSDKAEDRAFTHQGERLTNIEGWNHVVVIAIGDRVTTYLNGELRRDYSGERVDQAGFIGLQVHRGPRSLSGATVTFKDVHIAELDQPDYDQVRAAVEAQLPEPPAADQGNRSEDNQTSE